jgi:hypothetical protein
MKAILAWRRDWWRRMFSCFKLVMKVMGYIVGHSAVAGIENIYGTGGHL